MNNLSKLAVVVLLVGVAYGTPASAQSGYKINMLRQRVQKAAALVEAGKQSRATAVGLAKEERRTEAEAEYADALEKFATARRLDPSNITALLEAAWVHNEIGEFDQAAAVAEAALELDPYNAEAWREVGYAHWKRGDHPQAVRALRLAMQNNRTDLSAYTYLIGVLEEDGDDTAADAMRERKAAVERAIEANPFNPPVEPSGDD